MQQPEISIHPLIGRLPNNLVREKNQIELREYEHKTT